MKAKNLIILITILAILSIGLWVTTLAPLFTNASLNVAIAQAKHGNCSEALETVQKTSSNFTLSVFYRNQYVDVLNMCSSFIRQNQNLSYLEKATELLLQNVEQQPTFTRTWISLAAFTNLAIAESKDPEEQQMLAAKSEQYLQHALDLSPNRRQIFAEWSKTYLYSDQPIKAEELARKCLQVDESAGECWWTLARAQIAQNNEERAMESLIKAQNSGFAILSEVRLRQLAQTYTDAENFQGAIPIYQELIHRYGQESSNGQYHASLAFIYKELQEYNKATEYALRTLTVAPQNLQVVQEFIYTLPAAYHVNITALLQSVNQIKDQIQANPNSAQLHLNLARAYYNLARYGEAGKAAKEAAELNPSLQTTVDQFINTFPKKETWVF